MRGRGMLEDLFLDGIPVEPGDGAKPPGNGGVCPTSLLQVPGEEGLDVRVADRAQRQRPGTGS